MQQNFKSVHQNDCRGAISSVGTWTRMESENEFWEHGFENLYSEVADKYMQNPTVNDSTSVASLGSLGSASWVAGHFVQDESREAPIKNADWTPEIQSDNKGESMSTENQYSVSISLHEDFREQTQETQQRGRGFRCPHCNKAFTRRSEMGRHVGVGIIQFL